MGEGQLVGKWGLYARPEKSFWIRACCHSLKIHSLNGATTPQANMVNHKRFDAHGYVKIFRRPRSLFD